MIIALMLLLSLTHGGSSEDMELAFVGLHLFTQLSPKYVYMSLEMTGMTRHDIVLATPLEAVTSIPSVYADPFQCSLEVHTMSYLNHEGMEITCRQHA